MDATTIDEAKRYEAERARIDRREKREMLALISAPYMKSDDAKALWRSLQEPGENGKPSGKKMRIAEGDRRAKLLAIQAALDSEREVNR